MTAATRIAAPSTAAAGPQCPIPIRFVSRAAVEALVARLVASGAVEPPRAERTGHAG